MIEHLIEVCLFFFPFDLKKTPKDSSLCSKYRGEVPQLINGMVLPNCRNLFVFGVGQARYGSSFVPISLISRVAALKRLTSKRHLIVIVIVIVVVDAVQELDPFTRPQEVFWST